MSEDTQDTQNQTVEYEPGFYWAVRKGRLESIHKLKNNNLWEVFGSSQLYETNRLLRNYKIIEKATIPQT